MRKAIHKMTPWGIRGVILISVLFSALPLSVQAVSAAGNAFASLEHRLIQDGFPPDAILRLFPPNAHPMLNTIANSFQIRESKLNYAQFLEPAALRNARQFMARYENIFSKAEETYGVDRSVIAAILLVETQAGRYTGNTPTLIILSTFALMNQKSYRDQVWALMPQETRIQWGSYLFDRKLEKRAEWAYGELCSLLRWMSDEPERIGALRGSYMGAVGWPQFLPSSVLRYGVDGDQDGRVDLFSPTDAILSTANYLKAHGWQEGISRPEQEEVILHYNRSRPYANTVLEAAARLRQPAPSAGR